MFGGKKEKRFKTHEVDMLGNSVIVDSQTGVNYLQVTSINYGMAIVPLLKPDGTPIVTRDE